MKTKSKAYVAAATRALSDLDRFRRALVCEDLGRQLIDPRLTPSQLLEIREAFREALTGGS